ncbi:MAG TPA: UDP-N-acetylmuramate--L-alanine ligase [Gemmatimonadaceae bacterium]|nr:UDP-N-acetylmuramate--L-alanine ligase [Gemmatimonadaceae bacterium]
MNPQWFDPSDPRPVHFVGIAGAGMSALAELFRRRGVAVTGCDAAAGGADDVRRLGIAVADGHDPAHVDGVRALVVTSAMPQDHPELARARSLGIPVVRRAEALGSAVGGGTLVAVAGTHGKTTTTVMTTEALASAALEPTGLAGGRVGAWQGNLRTGGNRLFVVEADEYDRSFLALSPTVAVVTNVEADHLDVYRDLADIRGAFEQFLAPARTVILCADDPGASSLHVGPASEIVRYGLGSPDARLVGAAVMSVDGLLRFVVRFDGEELGDVTLRVPGIHNVRNALAATAAGLALGATFEQLRPGLEAFEGVERRFQRLGAVRGVDVVDDYAHHPTEILATLDAARAAFPGRRLLAAFQPHLYSRTRDFASEFGAALARADAVFLTEIYPAREQPIEGVTSGLIATALANGGRPPVWRGPREELASALASSVREGDVVLTLGAGDITRAGPELLQRLAAGT